MARWTDEEKAELKRLYKPDVSVQEVARILTAKFGRQITHASARRAAERIGSSRGYRRRWTDEQTDELRGLYESGLKKREIAEELTKKFGRSFTYNSVGCRIKQIGLKPRLSRWTAEERAELQRLRESGMTYHEIARLLNEKFGQDFTSSAVKGALLRFGCQVPAKPPPTLDEQGQLAIARGQFKQMKKERDAAVNHIGELNEIRDLLAATCQPLQPDTGRFKMPRSWRSKAEFPAVSLVSDWQIGEVVTAEETGGWGKFDYDAAIARVDIYATEFLKWLETMRSGLRVKNVYVLVLGDMVSGNIHYELEVTNEWPGPVAAVKSGDLLARYVSSLAPHAETVEVHFVGPDNHGRLTKKLQFKEGGLNNWNYAVHHVAQRRLERHANVKMHYYTSGAAKVQLPGEPVLMMHGHQVRAWMGIPFYGIQRMQGRRAEEEIVHALEEAKKALEAYRPFRTLIMGHWHVPAWLRGCVVNGCLPGTTELDHSLGRFSKPSQTSFLWHHEFGPFNLVPWVLDEKRVDD